GPHVPSVECTAISLHRNQRLGIRRESDAHAEIGNSLSAAALPAGCSVPETDVVPTYRGQRLAVGGEPDVCKILLVLRRGGRNFAARHIPELNEFARGGIFVFQGSQHATVVR